MAIKFDLEDLFINLKNINYDVLYNYFKENHKQRLYVKKLEEDGNLLMIHNNLEKTNDTNLYNECRSIIIDVTDNSKPKIISYSHDNVLYYEDTNKKITKEDNDIIEESYEGTMVGVFNHNEKWYFTSTRCPSIDDSYFFNKEKTHGMMFDEALKEIYPNSTDVRETLTLNLDKDKYYYFIILHHENKYIVDYSDRYGVNYKKLIHIITRDKITHNEITTKLEINSTSSVLYAQVFDTLELAYNWLNSNVSKEGLIVKRLDKTTNKTLLIKIPSEEYIKIRYEKPNYSNVWISCIEIFQRNNKDYRPDNFLQKYYPNKKILDKDGTPLDITGMLFYIIKNLAHELFVIYHYFTRFDVISGRFIKLNDVQFSRIFSANTFKTYRNQIQRLQNYQHKFLGTPFRFNDIVVHLRNYTSPEDIYNMIKEHDIMMELNHELYQLILSKSNDMTKLNNFISFYVKAE